MTVEFKILQKSLVKLKQKFSHINRCFSIGTNSEILRTCYDSICMVITLDAKL